MPDRYDLSVQIEEEIARLTREIEVLREAARVLRGSDNTKEHSIILNKDYSRKKQSESGDHGEFAGLTIEDVAAQILAEHADGLTASEVAQIALDRGYRSTSPRNPANDPEKIRQSFRVTMGRLRERFTMDAKVFKLRSSDQSQLEP